MSTFNGLPAHVLLVHFVVVLGPLTAALAIVCTFWPAARQRLVWLVLALAVITAGLTPLTTDAGEWLAKRNGPVATVACAHRIGRHDGVLFRRISGGRCADRLRPPSGRTWEISETRCAVAHCGRRGRRERSDGGAGLPHRGFGGKSDMEQASQRGSVFDLGSRSSSGAQKAYVIAAPTRCPMA